MERIEVNEMLRLLKDETTTGTPTKYALMRDATATPSSVGKWRIFVHPISDGNGASGWHTSVICRKYPTALDAATVTTVWGPMMDFYMPELVALLTGEL